MDTSQPGPLIMLAGGAVMIVASFLNWFPDTIGLSTDFSGLLGIIVLLTGIAVVAVTAIGLFAPDTKLPDDIAGLLDLDQLLLVLAFSAFLWLFAFQFTDGTEIGITLGWIGAGVASAGGVVSAMANATEKEAS